MRKINFKYPFILVWVISSLLLILNINYDFSFIRYIKFINAVYIISLIAYVVYPDLFGRFGKSDVEIIKIRHLKLLELVAVIVLISGLIIYTGLSTSPFFIFITLSIIISIYVLYIFSKEISKTIIITGIIVGIITTLYSFSVSGTFFSILVFPISASLYIAGSALNLKYLLTTVHINGQNYSQAIKSFLIGSILAIPMSLSNLSDVLITRPDAKWISGIWQSSLALPAGIFEETWFRLFILTLIFAIINPKTKQQFIPVIIALVISSLFHGFGHYPQIDLQNCLNITLYYSLPLGVLFIWRDFETAVGYHFMIDFIRVIGGILIST